MTGDPSKFSSLKLKNEGFVTYGDNNKGKILGHGNIVKARFKSKNQISTSRPLQLIHMDLFGPSRTMSLGGNYYGLVIVDDYSRFTWLFFLQIKVKLSMLLRNLLSLFKMRKTQISPQLEVTMEVNFKMFCSKNSVRSMALIIIFQHLGYLNKMGLWKGKIDLLRNWLGLC
uniref:Retrovirus-related Pol polyprotein from transposon TNT 1-94 n=1 Tax=Cajanus cajan TaxID=3821 RepID=A0A151QQU7_CAJCA|nr:hypothetical protein KK1_046570 [Cajanus cajan]